MGIHASFRITPDLLSLLFWSTVSRRVGGYPSSQYHQVSLARRQCTRSSVDSTLPLGERRQLRRGGERHVLRFAFGAIRRTVARVRFPLDARRAVVGWPIVPHPRLRAAGARTIDRQQKSMLWLRCGRRGVELERHRRRGDMTPAGLVRLSRKITCPGAAPEKQSRMSCQAPDPPILSRRHS